MRIAGILILACASFSLPLALAGAGGKTNAARIVGTWEATKGNIPSGSLVEFTKDEKLNITVKADDKEIKIEGTYKIDGDKLSLTVKGPDGESKTQAATIKTLNETTLILEATEGKGK